VAAELQILKCQRSFAVHQEDKVFQLVPPLNRLFVSEKNPWKVLLIIF